MKQFKTVLKFELGNYFKNKSFLITTIIIAVLAIGVVVVPPMIPGLLSMDTVEQAVFDGAEPDSRIGVLDTEDYLASRLPELTGLEKSWIIYDDVKKMSADVESETLDAGFVIDGPMEYTYLVQNNSIYDTKESILQQVMESEYKQDYLTAKGLSPEEAQEVLQAGVVSHREILGKDSAQNYWYTYVLIFALYFLILFYGQMIATSVTTEKSNRAIEILVTSVNPNSLIVGKVLAGAIAGILQMCIILGAAFGAYAVFRGNWGGALDFLFYVPAHVWVVYIIFGLLGYLLYAFLYGMLGALVSKTEDISKSSSLILMLYMVSFMIAMFGMGASDSLLMKVASFIPFTSTNAMLCRVTMGSVALWEIMLSGGILLISCIVVGILAAKMFRFGTLMYGNPIKFTTALKKIRSEK